MEILQVSDVRRGMKILINHQVQMQSNVKSPSPREILSHKIAHGKDSKCQVQMRWKCLKLIHKFPSLWTSGN